MLSTLKSNKCVTECTENPSRKSDKVTGNYRLVAEALEQGTHVPDC